MSKLSPEEIARYSRQVILPQIGLEGQRRLADSRMLVIGMGGLGSPVSLYLAAAGVGTLGLADFDKVEAHNLQRQIIHTDAGVGTAKLASAKERIHALNPTTNLVEHPNGVTFDNAVDLFAEYDLIIDGTDNFPTRYLNNDAAYFASKPLVYGSIFQFEGQVSVFDPEGGAPCYRCLFPRMPAPGTVPNCEEAGVFGALCGMVGSLQAMEAIKLATGAGEPLRGKLLVLDALGVNFRKLNLRRDPRCPLCGESPEITELKERNYEFSCAPGEVQTNPAREQAADDIAVEVDVDEAKRWLESANPPYLLDVREPFEVEICRIEGSHNIPMGQVPEVYGNLPGDTPVLVYCHHGMRSMRITQFLRGKGIKTATNLAGGINRWAEQIDPSMPRY